jgi:hypothetical protein
MSPTLPYELVSSILADVIGSYVHLRLMAHNNEYERPLDVWDAFSNLATVSRTFLEITRRLGSIACGPNATPDERCVSSS